MYLCFIQVLIGSMSCLSSPSLSAALQYLIGQSRYLYCPHLKKNNKKRRIMNTELHSHMPFISPWSSALTGSADGHSTPGQSPYSIIFFSLALRDSQVQFDFVPGEHFHFGINRSTDRSGYFPFPEVPHISCKMCSIVPSATGSMASWT